MLEFLCFEIVLTQTRTHTGTDTIQPTTMAESHANPLVKSGKRMATLLKI